MSDLVLRHAEAADLSALTGIYNHYVRETAVTFDVEPFAPEDRADWFGGFARSGRHQLFVAERDGRTLGYACSHAFRTRPAYDRTVETTIYLAPGRCGAGVGARLYGHLFQALAESDAHLAVAGIALPNPASVALHRRVGFERVGTFREVGHKLGRAWDVEWWQLPIGASGSGGMLSP